MMGLELLLPFVVVVAAELVLPLLLLLLHRERLMRFPRFQTHDGLVLQEKYSNCVYVQVVTIIVLLNSSVVV